MATFRIRFPEKESESTLLLSGARVTVGRRPDNTVQIIDRTISGLHAELILEDGHYRLHDRGSSNGTFVDGQRVTDFHLTEPCQISFGSVTCEFDPRATETPEEANAETLPNHGEVVAIREENATLKARVEALQTELAALQRIQAAPDAEDPTATLKSDFAKLLAEREAWQVQQQQQTQEIARLKTDLAVLQRDRENLQRALGNTRRELDAVKASGDAASSPAPESSGEPTSADAPPGSAEEVAPVVFTSLPATAATPSFPKPAPSFSPAGAATPSPRVPAGTRPSMVPNARPVASPQQPAVPATRPSGGLPAPKAVPVARPAARPPGGGAGPSVRPAGASPAGAPRPFVRAVARPATAVDTTSGKGATQKISAANPAKGSEQSGT
jgi:pSer/pThr/pTyr-binding forkhead associated (FHA) protein